MTARSAATASSFVLACAAASSASCWRPARTSTRSRSRRRSSRRWTSRASSACWSPASSRGGTDDVDANLETVRLLRSQLRTEVPAARDRSRRAAARRDRGERERDKRDNAGQARRTPPAGPATPVSPAEPGRRHRQSHDAETGDANADNTKPADASATINDEKDLAKFDKIFADVAYWKKLGEEYQSPLIVTGSVLFTPHADLRLRDAAAARSTTRTAAAAWSRTRTYMERKGFILQPALRLHRRPHGRDPLLGDLPRGSALPAVAERRLRSRPTSS